MIVTPYCEDPFFSLDHIQSFEEFFAFIQSAIQQSAVVEIADTSRVTVRPAGFHLTDVRTPRHFLSLSLPLDGVDPLMALQSLASAPLTHFYWENRKTDEAIAAIGCAEQVRLSGSQRFAQSKQVIQELFQRIVPIGPVNRPFAEPRVFCQFTFFDAVDGASNLSPSNPSPSTIVLPQWQIARHQSLGSFVANIPLAKPRAFRASCMSVWEVMMTLKKLSSDRECSSRRFSYSGNGARSSAQRSPRSSSSSASSVIARSFGQRLMHSDTPPHLPPHLKVEEPHRCSKNRYPALPTVSPEGRARFVQTVQSVLETIEQTSLNKAVLAHALDIELDERLEVSASLQSLRHYHSDCYLFSSQIEPGQTFLSASPERLLSIQSGHLITEAIAGSAPRGRTPSEDFHLAHTLLHNRKELHEHQLVVNFIRQQLVQLGLNPTRSLAPKILPLSTIQHLQTLIHAEIPSHLHPIDLVEALHPTPAVAGVPREMACELIRHHESFERSLYAAPMGWIDGHGNSEFLVGIRSALLNGRHARLYAGAGIVQGSNPQKELDEIELKLRSLYHTLIHPHS
ncbi:MAG: isochorismate synthase [Leptolyngbyaceae bacterium]|nr:isochorismate synthase [Leptolyngbyaceae bacterium]